METIPWLIACVCVYLMARRPRPKLDAPKSNHRLLRTYKTDLNQGVHRPEWHWECICRTTATEHTEEDAVNAFIKHRSLHNDAAETHYKRLYETTLQEFADYKKACYCKDLPTN